MNLGQLHKYTGELIAAGTDPKLPVILPGRFEDQPQELTDAMLINGPYHADPAPKMVAFDSRSGAGLLLSGQGFDMDILRESHNPTWPPVESPEPDLQNALATDPEEFTVMRGGITSDRKASLADVHDFLDACGLQPESAEWEAALVGWPIDVDGSQIRFVRNV